MSFYRPAKVEAEAFRLVFDVRGAAGEVVFLWGVCVCVCVCVCVLNRAVIFLRNPVLLGYPFTGPLYRDSRPF